MGTSHHLVQRVLCLNSNHQRPILPLKVSSSVHSFLFFLHSTCLISISTSNTETDYEIEKRTAAFLEGIAPHLSNSFKTGYLLPDWKPAFAEASSSTTTANGFDAATHIANLHIPDLGHNHGLLLHGIGDPNDIAEDSTIASRLHLLFRHYSFAGNDHTFVDINFQPF